MHLIAFGFILSACGAASDSEKSVSTWEAIQKRGTLRLGATPAEPWYFKDPQTGQWQGLGVALARELADSLSVEIEVIETTWGNAVAGLQANQFDVMFVLDPTPARARSIDFTTEPLLYYGLAALHETSLTVSAWADLNKPNIELAVTLGTSMDDWVSQNLPNASISRFATNDESVAAFQSRRCNAVVLFHPPLIGLQRKVGRGRITIPTPVELKASSAGMRREADKTWRNFVSGATRYYYESGRTQLLYEAFLQSRGIDPSTVPPIVRDRLDGTP